MARARHYDEGQGQAIMNRLKKDKLNNIANGIVLFEARLNGFRRPRRAPRRVPAGRRRLTNECANKDRVSQASSAREIVRLHNLGKALRGNPASKILKFWSLQIPNPFKFLGGDDKKKTRKATALPDADDPEAPQFVIAPCCSPDTGRRGSRLRQSGYAQDRRS